MSRSAAIRWAGRGVLVVALLFVLRAAADHRAALLGWRPGSGDAAALGAAVLLYAAGLGLLALAWALVVRGVAGRPVALAPLARSWATTQLAKYVPGNVAHLAARHLAARRMGLPDKTLALAALGEAALLAAAAALSATASVLLAGLALPGGAERLVPMALVGLILVLGAGGGAAFWRLGASRARDLAAAALITLAFFALFGLAAALLLGTVAGVPPLAAGGAAIAAWIVGYLTPGAPAGLGTREAAFLLLLDGQAPVPELLLAAAVLRLATTLGDALCFGAGLAAAPKASRPPPAQGAAAH